MKAPPRLCIEYPKRITREPASFTNGIWPSGSSEESTIAFEGSKSSSLASTVVTESFPLGLPASASSSLIPGYSSRKRTCCPLSHASTLPHSAGLRGPEELGQQSTTRQHTITRTVFPTHKTSALGMSRRHPTTIDRKMGDVLFRLAAPERGPDLQRKMYVSTRLFFKKKARSTPARPTSEKCSLWTTGTKTNTPARSLVEEASPAIFHTSCTPTSFQQSHQRPPARPRSHKRSRLRSPSSSRSVSGHLNKRFSRFPRYIGHSAPQRGRSSRSGGSPSRP
jgi:hypothetical protein